MKISNRLNAILSMVPKGTVVADVGSDHGKLIISLFQNGIIKKGYAIENKKGPYSRLVAEIEKNNLSEHIVPLFSDGISELPKSVDTIVIAGMGGTTIIEILKKDYLKLNNVQTIIVDAHNSIPLLREEVNKLGYIIADETIIEEEGIYYEIIKFIKGDIAIYGEKDFKFGPILRNEKSPTFQDKYRHRLQEINALLQKKNLPEKKINFLKEERDEIQGIL